LVGEHVLCYTGRASSYRVVSLASVVLRGSSVAHSCLAVVGNGIINADGELWRIQRKAGLRFFSNANLKTFINDILPPLLAETKRDLDEASRTGAVIDLQNVLLELTTRLIGKMAYDVSRDAEGSHGCGSCFTNTKKMDMHGSLPFSKAFDFASGETTSRFTNPFWKIKEFFLGRRLRKAIEEVHSYGRTVVAEAVQKRSAKSTEKHFPLQSNLIDSLLDHLPSEDLVADAAMNFLSAGRDTTAQSLTWTFYNLMRHPSIISILREELASLLPAPSPKFTSPLSPSAPSAPFTTSDPVTGSTATSPCPPPPPPLPLTYETIAPTSLPYTLALFSETLRLYPPVPFELKEATAPTTFPDGTFLPANSVVLWVPWAMGRSTRIWGDDALEFRPGRWLDYGEPLSEPVGAAEGEPSQVTEAMGRSEGGGGSEAVDVSEAVEGREAGGVTGSRGGSGRSGESRKRGKPTLLAKSAYENPVFNAGPRTCLGKKMAELLAVYVVAALLWEYEFEEMVEEGVDGRTTEGGGGSGSGGAWRFGKGWGFGGERGVGGRRERVSQNSLTLPMEGGLPVRVRRRVG